MKQYCPHCDQDRELNVITTVETYPVKGKDITITANVKVCSCCENEIWDPDLDDDNLRKAYNKYREINNLLTPDQIKQIRVRNGLSQVAFAKILGLGEKTIARYENGSLQDEAQNNLIMLVSDPTNFERLLRKNEHKLTGEEREYIDLRFLSIPPYRYISKMLPYRYSTGNERCLFPITG